MVLAYKHEDDTSWASLTIAGSLFLSILATNLSSYLFRIYSFPTTTCLKLRRHFAS